MLTLCPRNRSGISIDPKTYLQGCELNPRR